MLAGGTAAATGNREACGRDHLALQRMLSRSIPFCDICPVSYALVILVIAMSFLQAFQEPFASSVLSNRVAHAKAYILDVHASSTDAYYAEVHDVHIAHTGAARQAAVQSIPGDQACSRDVITAHQCTCTSTASNTGVTNSSAFFELSWKRDPALGSRCHIWPVSTGSRALWPAWPRTLHVQSAW